MINSAGKRPHLPSLAAALATLVAIPTGASANEDPFAGATALGRGQLAVLRGGMLIGGIPVNFAVTIRTTIQQAMQPAAVLETTLAIDDSGRLAGATTTAGTSPVVKASAAPGAVPISISMASPASAGGLAPAAGTPSTVAQAPAGSASSAPAASAPAAPAAVTAVAIGNGTNIIQQISRYQVETLISNAANGLSISHTTSIDAVLPTIVQATTAFTSRFQAARLGYQSAIAAVRG